LVLGLLRRLHLDEVLHAGMVSIVVVMVVVVMVMTLVLESLSTQHHTGTGAAFLSLSPEGIVPTGGCK